MYLNQLLLLVMNLSTLVFVVTSMLAMGLSLTLAEIGAPLRNARLVILALAANFVLVPIVAYLITFVLPLSEGFKVGMILVSLAAGGAVSAKAGSNSEGQPGVFSGVDGVVDGVNGRIHADRAAAAAPGRFC
jgi:predicted Na+-dependent transporter